MSDKITEIKNLLGNYEILKSSIKTLETELKEIELEDGLNSFGYGDVKVSTTNKVSSITENTAIRNIARKEIINKRISINKSKLIRIDNALNALSDIEKAIVQKRLIEKKSWISISIETKYSEKSCARYEKKGLEKLKIAL